MQGPHFDSLPEDDSTLRQITMLGPVSYQEGDAAEMRCEVVFARCTPGGGFEGTIETFQVGVGSLPWFRIGQYYQGRQRLDERSPQWHRAEKERVECLYKGKPFPLGKTIGLPPGPDGRPPAISPYPLGGIGETACVYSLQTQAPNKDPHQATLLPVHELIRYLWGRTTEFYKRTFDGQLGIHPSEPIFDATRSGWDEEGALQITTGKRSISNGELWALWRLFTDENANRGFRSIFADWQASQTTGTTAVHPHARFMLPGGLLWDFDYVWIARPHPTRQGVTERRRLITRIIRVHEPTTDIRIRLITPPTVESRRHGTQLQTRTKLLPIVQPGIGVPREPSRRYVEQIHLDSSDDLPKMTIERVAGQVEGGPRPVRTIYQVEEQTRPGSTADRGSGNTGVVPVSSRDGPGQAGDVEEIPNRLAPFIAALDHLNSFGLQAEVVQSPSNNQFWRFPLEVSGKSLTWSWIHRGARIQRRVAIGKVRFEGWLYYLFEVENSGAPGDVYSVGILPQAGVHELDGPAIVRLLSQLAKARCSWRRVNGNFLMQRHETSWSPRQLAQHLATKIRENTDNRLNGSPF